MDDGVALSSSLERLKLEALDSFPVVKMFDGCNLAGKGALDGFKRADIFNRSWIPERAAVFKFATDHACIEGDHCNSTSVLEYT